MCLVCVCSLCVVCVVCVCVVCVWCLCSVCVWCVCVLCVCVCVLCVIIRVCECGLCVSCVCFSCLVCVVFVFCLCGVLCVFVWCVCGVCIFLLLIMLHHPKMKLHTLMCLPIRTCLLVGDVGSACALGVGHFIPFTMFILQLVFFCTCILHLHHYSLSQSTEFVNFINDFRLLVISSCLLIGQIPC